MTGLRATWQVQRQQLLLPVQGQSTAPTRVMVTQGTYVGDYVPASNIVQQPVPGAPFVELEGYAFFAAGVDIQEGDILIRLEKNDRWEAKGVQTFTTRTIVGVKGVKSKSGTVA
jgi:hypothetical protein